MFKSKSAVLLLPLLLAACSPLGGGASPAPAAVDQRSKPAPSTAAAQHAAKVQQTASPASGGAFASSAATAPGQSPVISPAPAAQKPLASGTDLPKPDHVVIVVEENHSFEKVIGSKAAPYINGLVQQGAFFTQSFAVAHPSQPNYLVLFSGSDQGIKDDSCGHTFKAANLASSLIQAQLTFGGYSEDLPETGSTACTHGQYGRKHSPWVNFSNVPKETNMPLDSFPADDFSKLPTVSFVIPNLDNDMHDGSIRAADDWLKEHLDPYVQWAASHNSLLIVTWDEDDNSRNNHIPTLMAGPMVAIGSYDQRITHLNVLRTLEDMYGLPHAGKSGDAAAITGVWR
ncbi:acid phosphatase [Paenibacillus athensensis]|uniref:Acid phosphatase n=1 Tax=Paenibacillus athensensis TaxID=1967502 RepID=A0A4Y8PY67_9BACL|nr:alkaline phosphatase family protein [Paenibacillus athensensis]MCD1259689.1 acid phosphatase [Paenibacillus athensensis]